MPLQVHWHNLCKKGNLNTNNNNNGDVIKFVQQLPSTWFVSLSVHTNCSCSKPNLLTVMMTVADDDFSRFAQNIYFLKHSHSSSKYLFPAKLAKTCVAGLSPHLQQIVGKLFTKLFTTSWREMGFQIELQNNHICLYKDKIGKMIKWICNIFFS